MLLLQSGPLTEQMRRIAALVGELTVIAGMYLSYRLKLRYFCLAASRWL